MAYAYYSQITVDKTKVGETDANLAVLISGTYDGTGGEPDLRTVANGGNIQNTAAGGASGSYTVPADLVFSPNTNGSSPYDFEIEKYNAATGEIVAWVQCGVDTAADKVFYMVYGDSGVTTSQENVAGTWDANFKGIWHFIEGSGSAVNDSTGVYDGTLNQTDHWTTSGKVGNAYAFDGVDDYVNIGTGLNASLSPSDAFSISAWVKVTTISTTVYIVANAEMAGNYVGMDIRIGTDGKPLFLLVNNGLTDKMAVKVTDTVTINDGNWRFIVVTYNGSWLASGITLYVDGTLAASTATYDTINADTASTANLQIGVRAGTYGPFPGSIDEVRISNSVRSADYVTTAFNNQSSPSTFYSVGAEQRAAAAASPRMLMKMRFGF